MSLSRARWDSFWRSIRPRISDRLVGGAGWDRLLERAAETPATMGAFPFGFEIPLQDARPVADFGVTLLGGSRTAAGYRDRKRSGGADKSTTALAGLLEETDREDSLLRHVVGRKMLLEYDIDREPGGGRPDPGVFLYPVDDVLAGGGDKLRELHAVHDARRARGRLDAGLCRTPGSGAALPDVAAGHTDQGLRHVPVAGQDRCESR